MRLYFSIPKQDGVNQMKQYGTAATNFTSAGMARGKWSAPIRMEALLAGSYSRMVRGNRRRLNKDATAWWREQSASQKANGMVWQYHCGGVG